MVIGHIHIWDVIHVCDTTGDGFAKMTPAWLKQALIHSDDTTETPEQQQQQHLQDTEIDYVLHALP